MPYFNEIEAQRIRDLARAGKFRDATTALNVIQDVDGGTTEVLQLGAEIVGMAGNHAGALDILKKLVQRAPKNARTLRLVGRNFEAINDQVNARRAYYEATLADPNDEFSLARAASLFEATNEFAIAYGLAERLIQRNPTGQQLFELKLMQASCLYNLGSDAEGLKLVDELLAQAPHDPKVLTLLGRVRLHGGDATAAREAFERAKAVASPDDAVTIENLISFVDGKVAQGQDIRVTEALFDRYAAKFDRHLVGQLKYSAPEKVAQLAKKHFGETSFHLLDLGCGTGLVAEALLGQAGGRVGVDISEKMLREAQRKHLYYRLHQVDIREAMASTKAESFDLIVAADVFNYIGQLDQLASDAYRVLRPGGLFCFTVELDEANPDSQATAATNMRILHGRNAIEKLLVEAGFQGIALEEFTLRYEAGEPVGSALCSGVKSAN